MSRIIAIVGRPNVGKSSVVLDALDGVGAGDKAIAIVGQGRSFKLKLKFGYGASRAST